MYVKVTAAIIENDGKILIAKRKSDDRLKGRWELPGGKIRGGETPEQCLKREIKEELGIDIEVGRFFTSSKFTYPHISIELLVYFAKWKGGDIRVLAHDEVRWVYPHELLDYSFADADLPVVKRLILQK
ncbi:MAG: 8-oxo-dGTP diphosphatase MutT [Deltaproteobacteria bacterium]|nr:8-oxo-dGTP diphosphatase MutT [Deltaproteobacteria bacterium]